MLSPKIRYLLVGLGPAILASCGQIPFPSQDIQLVCTDPPAIQRYDLAAGEWSEERSFERLRALANPRPIEGGLGLGGKPLVVAETRAQTLLWFEGDTFLVFDGRLDPAPVVRFVGLDPEKKALAFSLRNTGIPGPFALLDLDSCGPDGCDWKRPHGFPVWSPDGSHTILSRNTAMFPAPPDPDEADDRPLLSRGDGEGQLLKKIGPGSSPFWLDNETYGYIRPAPSDESGQEVVIASIENDDPQVLLTLEDLLERLPADRNPYRPLLGVAAGNPANPNLLSLQVADSRSGREEYIFLVHRSVDPAQGSDISLRLQVDDAPVWGMWFSPDGRWLMLSSTEQSVNGSRTWALYLHDIDRNQTTVYRSDISEFVLEETNLEVLTGYDWSQDGQWLVKVGDGTIDLIAPAHDREERITHEFNTPTCPIVSWTR